MPLEWLPQVEAYIESFEQQHKRAADDIDAICSRGGRFLTTKRKHICRQFKARYPDLWRKAVVDRDIGSPSVLLFKRLAAVAMMHELRQLMKKLQSAFEQNMVLAKSQLLEYRTALADRAPSSSIGMPIESVVHCLRECVSECVCVCVCVCLISYYDWVLLA
jgi:hypothetical protein